MTDRTENLDQAGRDQADLAPGDEDGGQPGGGVAGYVIGLALSVLLTAAAFGILATNIVWAPAIPAALVALAMAQMGVHLVFFLHITTGPDNTNNVLALAFGVLIVALVVLGSIWIMTHLNHQNMPMAVAMKHFS